MSTLKFRAALAAAAPGLAALALACPATAARPATPLFEDSAVGSGSQPTFSPFSVSVTSGASGENPSGSADVTAFGVEFTSTSITCLSVTGNTAVYAGTLASNPFGFAYFKATVVDNGPADSGLDTVAANGFSSPQDCSTPINDFGGPVTSGDIVVVDSPAPPQTRAQCRHGGYRTYGFANVGSCISYVRNHPGA